MLFKAETDTKNFASSQLHETEADNWFKAMTFIETPTRNDKVTSIYCIRKNLGQILASSTHSVDG